ALDTYVKLIEKDEARISAQRGILQGAPRKPGDPEYKRWLAETQKARETLREAEGTFRADCGRLFDLALAVEGEKAWQALPVHANARYQRALVLLRLKDFPQAVDVLEGMPDSFVNYTSSQYRLFLT